MENNVTADVVSQGAAPTPVATPVIETAPTVVDPVEAKVKEFMAKERKTILEEATRLGQSGKDKAIHALQQELQEEKARRIALEGGLNTLHTQLGPDADQSMVQNVRLAQTNAQLGVYRQQEFARQQAQREQEAKEAVLQETRSEVAELGLEPDDPRIQYDLNQSNATDFRRKVLASVRAALKEDRDKELDDRSSKIAADVEARVRKATGVDSHDTDGGGGGKPTFTKEQIKDRAFYTANKEAIQLARLEGRIK